MSRRLVIVVLIDALGWEIAEQFGFAERLLPRRAALGTVLGYSSAAIPSLLSGATPAEHRSWAMWRRADARSPFRYLRWLPRLPHALEWRTRRLVRHVTDRRGTIDGYYDLYDIPVHVLGHFDVAQHQDPYQPGGLSCETVFDWMTRSGTRYRLWYYKTPEADNMAQMADAVGGQDEVLFLYTAELDALMHRVGVFDDRVGERLRRYERFLERILERAARAGADARVYLLSDHGMTDVDRSVDVWGALERRGHRLGRDYLAFFDSTMARFWDSDAAARAAAEIIEEDGWGRMLDDEELRSFGCYFEGSPYGDRVLLAHPGVMIVPSFMGREQIAAMHGYDPGDPFSKGVFMTNDRDGDLPESILGFKDYLLARVGDGI